MDGKSLMVLLLLSSILFYEKIGRMKYSSFARKVREQWDMNTFILESFYIFSREDINLNNISDSESSH